MRHVRVSLSWWQELCSKRRRGWRRRCERQMLGCRKLISSSEPYSLWHVTSAVVLHTVWTDMHDGSCLRGVIRCSDSLLCHEMIQSICLCERRKVDWGSLSRARLSNATEMSIETVTRRFDLSNRMRRRRHTRSEAWRQRSHRAV